MHAVTILATRDDGGEFQFAPESELWDHSGGEFVLHKDKHGMREHDYHLMEFVLDDQTGAGLKFPRVPHDAMWVALMEDRANPVCPNKDTVSDYEVLEPICVCDEQRRLIVRNDNPRREDWAFTLNFVKRGEDESDASRYVSWDPVTSNQDGGTGSHG
jgi:hypothetical protein